MMAPLLDDDGPEKLTARFDVLDEDDDTEPDDDDDGAKGG